MKPTPLLDFWQRPEEAGAAVAVLATTFVLDPEFFERDCLARFVAAERIDEETGSSADLIAKIELEERLAEASVCVLADRSTRADRASLRWDLLHCHVPGALLHSKVTVLLWERAARVIVGSANLTAAGYRSQIELALAADLGEHCLIPPAVLSEIADELGSYLALLPSGAAAVPAVVRAGETLQLFRERIAQMPVRAAAARKLRVSLAPTAPGRQPLDELGSVWEGPKPLRASHVSPFWDSADPSVLRAVRSKLTGHGAKRQTIATVVSPSGTVPVTPALRAAVTATVELGPLDQELRRLHAKCLLVESDRWVAAMVGSSNHTKAGLGLGGARHRELNLWLGAATNTDEGRWLLGLVPLGKAVPSDAPTEELSDEDEIVPAELPLGFGLCRLQLTPSSAWSLLMQLVPAELPTNWSASTTSGHVVLTSAAWRTEGARLEWTAELPPGELPTYLEVAWGNDSAPWTVIADDRADLPPGPGVEDLTSRQLLAALASGKTLSAHLEDLERSGQAIKRSGPELDPLKRFDDRGSLLRRGRALSAALAHMQRRLGQPVLTLAGLEARLASPLGPEFVVSKVVSEAEAQDVVEAQFTVAEVALALSRVDWDRTLANVDRGEALAILNASVERVDAARKCLAGAGSAVALYGDRALEEVRRCLAN